MFDYKLKCPHCNEKIKLPKPGEYIVCQGCGGRITLDTYKAFKVVFAAIFISLAGTGTLIYLFEATEGHELIFRFLIAAPVFLIGFGFYLVMRKYCVKYEP